MKEALPFYTYEEILERMLDRVPNDLDKREGSIVYDMLSIEAIELAQHYAELPYLVNLFYPDTATGEWLDRAVKQYAGIIRKQATYALRLAIFTDREGALLEVPIGARFSINDITLYVEKEKEVGKYEMRVEQPGTMGNRYSGKMLPLDTINNLGAAILGEVIIQARDGETDAELRKRFYKEITRPAFGGNISDYENKALSITGVGAAMVFPVWNGSGTVMVIIGNEEQGKASDELVQQVQNLFMPSNDKHLGLGLAPVGHDVTVKTSQEFLITVQATVTPMDGYTLDNIRNNIVNSINDYIKSIPFDEDIIYLARIISAILMVGGVKDVSDVTISYIPGNVKLGKRTDLFETPVLGEVTLKEGTS